MPEIRFPYGREYLSLDIPESRHAATLLSKMHGYLPEKSPIEPVRDMHMIPAHSPGEALALADAILKERGIENAKITAIPDGVSVIVA